jgi:dihydrofolate reductase
MIRLIAIIDRKRGIGKHGYQPWYIPEDEKYFTEQTKTHGGNVLVGIATFKTFKGSLVGRQNYVLTHHNEPIEGVTLVHDMDKFLKDFRYKDLWVIGGANVFSQVMQAGKADELYITHIDAEFGCDRFLPPYEKDFKLVEQTEPQEQNGFTFTYARYAKVI